MKNRDRIQRRMSEIKSMADQLPAIKELADLTFEMGEDACEERKGLRELTQQNRFILVGNGHQEDSIIYKLGQTVVAQAEMMKTLTSIQKSLVGDIETPEAESIISRLRDVERVIANINKLTWLIVSVFLTQIVLFIWAFFIH